MEHDPQKASDLLFETAGSGYDPLADPDADNGSIDESEGQQGPHAEYRGPGAVAPAPHDRPAPQRHEELFSAQAPRRRVLLGILRFLDAPRHSDLLQQRVEELQAYDASVYSGHSFSLLLAEAGAVRKVNEDGSAFDEEAEQLPDVVEVDGLKFFKPTDGRQVFWLITDEGRAYLESDDPFARLTGLIAEEPRYRTIYGTLLELCDGEAGRSAADLAERVDNDPLVQQPRRYSAYFVKKLEDCGALLWTKQWHTTELGKRALGLLFPEGPEAEAEAEAEREQPTEGEQL
jgi:hypothetical protein